MWKTRLKLDNKVHGYWLFLASLLMHQISITSQVEVTYADDADFRGPSLVDSLTTPLVVAEGQSAAITCVVRNIGNFTVLWRDQNDDILTVGSDRITTDKRMNVVHDDGGDVWVLAIQKTKHSDTGTYKCQVNTNPSKQSFHKLTVLSQNLVAPPSSGQANYNVTGGNSESVWGYTTASPIAHDYTLCCKRKGVSTKCFDYCDIKNILDGSVTTHPTECESDFPAIVECMAAGRNHVPCCEKAQVPDVCQDMCVGTYTVQTDDARTHISCAAYTAPTLACIAEGVDIIPPQPQELRAEQIMDTKFILRWSSDPYVSVDTLSAPSDTPPITNFIVSVSMVKSMVPVDTSKFQTSFPESSDTKTMNFTTPGNKEEALVEDLKPYTLYNVSVTAENQHGRSLPSYHLLVLTLSVQEAKLAKANIRDKIVDPGAMKEVSFTTPAPPPKLPNATECCASLDFEVAVPPSCTAKMCDYKQIQDIQVIDMMMCASWTWDLFSCLVDGRNHEPCCRRRGVPDVCSTFCSGNATEAERLHHKHFKCERYMPDIANCFMESYEVLPSEPRNFFFSNVGRSIGLLHWDAPLLHSDSVTHYRVHLDKSTQYPYAAKAIGRTNFQTVKSSPFVLEGLEPATSYIAFVEAVNEYGVSPMSTIAAFRTALERHPSAPLKEPRYDQKDCCSSAGVKDECLALCRFNASISEAGRLAPLCKEDFHRITKCQASGRDHLPCCMRRGVSARCQPLCQGTQLETGDSVFGSCINFIGNIMTCLEEGILDLPPPVEGFHAQFVDDTKVSFSWELPQELGEPEDETQEAPITQFEIYYMELKSNSSSGYFAYDKNINVTGTQNHMTIAGLKPETLHQFFIVSRNSQGTSLPTSLITLNTSRAGWDGQNVKGLPSPPHEIRTAPAADSIELWWTAPVIASATDYHKYKITYGPVPKADGETSTEKTSVVTSSTTVKLRGLTPNTQYVIYLNTIQINGKRRSESLPSETVVAWTDPLIGAVAEPPKVTPYVIKEGDSFQVLCIGLGNPIPSVSLYVDGHKIKASRSRHLVVTIHNVSKYMQVVGCEAENPKNRDYKESRLNIQFKPVVASVEQHTNTTTLSGKEYQVHTITCKVRSRPPPVVRIGRNDGRDVIVTNGTVSAGGRGISFRMDTPDDNDFTFDAVMTISDFRERDSAKYYCNAENEMGTAAKDFPVKHTQLKTLPRHDTLRTCCQAEHVQDQCLDICTFRLDFDLLSLEGNTCNQDFPAYMKCGADQSDHRHCCQQAGVSEGCLDFCRGKVPSDAALSADGIDIGYCLNFMRKIGQCFQEGQYTLPGPPRNIHVQVVDKNLAVAKWDPPVKNPENVQLYRIIWRQPGAFGPSKIDTPYTNVTLTNLQPDKEYELVVKSGNSEGTSVLSPPITFVMADNYVVKGKTIYVDTSALVGGLLAVLILLAAVAVFVLYTKGRLTLFKRPSTPIESRSFDNPFYVMSNLQAVAESSSAPASTSTATEEAEAASAEAASTSRNEDSPTKRVAAKLTEKLRGVPSDFGFQRFE